MNRRILEREVFHGNYTGSALTALRLEYLASLALTVSGPNLHGARSKMSEKKRKRHEERPDGRPSKEIARESPSQKIKVSVIEDGDEWMPVLGECS